MINNSKILKIAVVCTLIVIFVFVGVIWYKKNYQTKVPGLVNTLQSKADSQYPVPNSGGAFAVLYPFTPTNDFVSNAQALMTIHGYVSSIQPATGALAKDYMIVKLRTTGGQAIINDFYVKNNTPIVRQNKDKQNKGTIQDLTNNALVNVTILKNVKQNSQWTVSQVTITQ